MEKFKFIDHISDLQFAAYGKTLNELFENCASAMFEGMLPEIKVEEKFMRKGNLISENLTELLHDFLNELLFIFETEHKVFKKFIVAIKKNGNYNLNFTASGDKSENYVIDVGIKGITYHELSAEKKKIGRKIFWEANVLCDI
ncbi:putative Protein archease [groundwater metagenome]|uniref:Archease domain-containing protein n=1 Tax=groundwater metagenome TaxID=717931 RepID=A0A098EB50_9ZZZZ